jgi:hypothetical protein
MSSFRISIQIDEQFTKEDLWPDGDEPENPTAKDVVELIRKCGGVKRIIEDWNLFDYIECTVWDDKNMEYI